MVEGIVLKNLSTNVTLELDKVTTLYYILDSVDWGQITSTHHSFKYVNQVGKYVTGTSLETRDVNITGWVIAKSEAQMTQRKNFLNRFVNPQQVMEISYKNYILDFLPDTSIKYSAVIKENNDVVCKFSIVGTAFDPLFRDAVEGKIEAVSTTSLFHFPLMIGGTELGYPTVMFGIRTPSLIINVYNAGAVSTGMRMVFRAKGTVINPSIINVETQEFFKINKTLSAGEQVVVETATGEKKVVGSLNGGAEENYFKYRDLDSTWLQLAVGDNLFRYDAERNLDGLEVYIYSYNRYLEVQECF